LHIECGLKSDQGKIRTSNEDQHLADLQINLFLVADGMGGHAAGEVASQITASTIHDCLLKSERSDPQSVLRKAVQYANTKVYDSQHRHSEYRGMGSTLTALMFNENRYYIAQVGDSRAYLLRKGELTQLTRDHSLVWDLYENHLISKENLSRHPRKNIITRSIGTYPEIEPDILSDQSFENDTFMICSDGLTDVLSDSQIQQFLSRYDKNPQEVCEMLVEAANEKGGPDNITVVVVRLIPD
jgi:protein phosphatase